VHRRLQLFVRRGVQHLNARLRVRRLGHRANVLPAQPRSGHAWGRAAGPELLLVGWTRAGGGRGLPSLCVVHVQPQDTWRLDNCVECVACHGEEHHRPVRQRPSLCFCFVLLRLASASSSFVLLLPRLVSSGFCFVLLSAVPCITLHAWESSRLSTASRLAPLALKANSWPPRDRNDSTTAQHCRCHVGTSSEAAVPPPPPPPPLQLS
jgi:hypothetical protein